MNDFSTRLKRVTKDFNSSNRRIDRAFPENPKYPYPSLIPFSACPIEENEILATEGASDATREFCLNLYEEMPKKRKVDCSRWHGLIKAVEDPRRGEDEKLLAKGILSMAGQVDLPKEGWADVKAAALKVVEMHPKDPTSQINRMMMLLHTIPVSLQPYADRAWDGVSTWRC